MKTSTHHSSVHLNSNIFTDKDVWMPKVLMTAKDLRESLTDLSELPKLTEIEPKSTKHNEFVQKEDQNDGKDIKEPKHPCGVLRKNCIHNFDWKNVARYSYGLVALGHQSFSFWPVRYSQCWSTQQYNKCSDGYVSKYGRCIGITIWWIYCS